MTAVAFVTVTVCCIAIGASVVSILLFVLYARLQRQLIVSKGDSRLPDDTASAIRLMGDSLKYDVPDDRRKVLKAVVRRYARTTLVSVLDDPIERSYLFEALTDAETVPWGSGAAPKAEQDQRVSTPQE